MINCRKCNFLIKSNMRHSLTKNCCPACGSAVLGDTQTRRMRLFKQRLMQQEFSANLSEDLIFDITLFMLLEFSPISKDKGDEDDADTSDQADQTAPAREDHMEEYEKIREEIREEVLLAGESLEEGLDEDLKIARLKRLAKESKLGQAGTSVRRLSND